MINQESGSTNAQLPGNFRWELARAPSGIFHSCNCSLSNPTRGVRASPARQQDVCFYEQNLESSIRNTNETIELKNPDATSSLFIVPSLCFRYIIIIYECIDKILLQYIFSLINLIFIHIRTAISQYFSSACQFLSLSMQNIQIVKLNFRYVLSRVIHFLAN